MMAVSPQMKMSGVGGRKRTGLRSQKSGVWPRWEFTCLLFICWSNLHQIHHSICFSLPTSSSHVHSGGSPQTQVTGLVSIYSSHSVPQLHSPRMPFCHKQVGRPPGLSSVSPPQRKACSPSPRKCSPQIPPSRRICSINQCPLCFCSLCLKICL